MGFVTLKCGHFYFNFFFFTHYFIIQLLVTLDFKAQFSQLANY